MILKFLLFVCLFGFKFRLVSWLASLARHWTGVLCSVWSRPHPTMPETLLVHSSSPTRTTRRKDPIPSLSPPTLPLWPLTGIGLLSMLVRLVFDWDDLERLACIGELLKSTTLFSFWVLLIVLVDSSNPQLWFRFWVLLIMFMHVLECVILFHFLVILGI